jgi:L-aminopeptidase/D-esterase-like protein
VRGRGFPVGDGVVPIVPAAVVFDLQPIGRFDARPTAEMAYQACDGAVASGFGEGSIGVGTGATVGKALGREKSMKGGFGCAVAQRDSVSVAAFAAVNALGDVRDADGNIIAGALDESGHFADSRAVMARASGQTTFDSLAGTNTTLCVVGTNAGLSRAQLTLLAQSATAAFVSRVTPAATIFDGDILFAVCPSDAAAHASAAELKVVESLVMEALGRAIERGVRLAKGRDGIRGLADNDRST